MVNRVLKSRPMLCDDLIRYARSRRGDDGEDRYIRRVAALCQEGERFVLDNEGTDVVLNVEDSKPTTLAAALNLCRLPFPITWIEGDLLHRMKRLRNYGYDPLIPKSVRGIRSGILLIANDGTLQRGKAYNVSQDLTKGGKDIILVNPVHLDFDLTPDNELRKRFIAPHHYRFLIKPDYLVDVTNHPQGIEENKYIQRVRKDPVEHETLMALENRFLLNVDDDGSSMLRKYMGKMSPTGFQFLLRTACKDWQGERRWIIGILLLLNSRNLFRLENQSVSTKNKHRSTRQPPDIISHKNVKIHLTKVGENRMNSQGYNSSQEMAWHKVRGHWKVRKTGVFFWRPYTRGNPAKGVIERNYTITR